MRIFAFLVALLVPVFAFAGNSKITKKDGSVIQVVTTDTGSTVDTFDKSGKKISTSTEASYAGEAKHQELVKKLAPGGSRIDWGS